MADVLLNKVINEEISSKILIKWLLKAVPEKDEDFNDLFTCNVTQIDFITYFLNFIHEEVPCNNKLLESLQKLNTPKRLDKVEVNITKETHQETSKKCKTALFPTQPSTAQDQNSSFNTSLNNSVENNSTPKIVKSTVNKNDNYFSPISPLYQNPNQNNFGLRESKQNTGSKKCANKYSLCLGDFIVTSSKNSSKKKKQNIESTESIKEASRRIKPTSVCLKQADSGFQKTENSFNFKENLEEVPVKTVIEQRNHLKKEMIKILSRQDSIETSNHPALIKRHNSLSKSDVKPMLSMVTFKNNINYVVDIYKTILNHRLVLNITSEIYFLISVFLTKHSFRNSQLEDDKMECSNLGVDFLDSKLVESNKKPTKFSLYNSEIFDTIHNIVYFAIKCLETQIKVIQFYDKTTIRLLAENERLLDFSPVLSKKLLTYAEKKTEKPWIEIITTVSQTNVCFNMDTDNKQNFPDQVSFQAFRKQRDLFYEILRIWETQHLVADWNFSLGLGGKVRSLFNFHGGPSNYMHLARLFKNQLLSSCAKGPKEKGQSETNLSFLPSLAIDADKLTRLTNRLVTKQASNGINSLPVFSGYQEFFKDFIVASSNYFFNKHLCDNLISEINELNDSKFGTELEEDEEGNEVDLTTRKLYIDCVKNLRILAKFLGFVESLPYRSDGSNLPKNVLEAQIQIRKENIPLLNIKSLLESSIENHTVVLLIPWLTKYLAMLDYVTLRLPYYKPVLSVLFDLYQNYDSLETWHCNAAMVKFCLGWLFELPHFPDVEYFNFCSKVIDTRQLQAHSTTLIVSRNGINDSKMESRTKYLDRMGIINESVLYLCCPYLEEIKKLLSTNAPGSKVAAKYITPVTAIESNSEMGKKKIEQQLEEAFFSGQPTSLRKTIEFVSERIASTAVKHICHHLVPEAKEMAMKDLKEILLNSDINENFADENHRKAALRKQATAFAQTHLTRFFTICDEEVQKISRQKIPPSIDSLLPVDALVETKNVCVGITNKMYTERVKQWINSRVNLAVFTKDFDSEVQKAINGKRTDKEKVAFILPAGGRNCIHKEDTLSGFHALNNIREACCNLTECSDITLECVLNVLQETYKTLTQRNDVNDMIFATICMTVFDFCLLLVAQVPSLFSESKDDLVNYFSKIWILQPKPSPVFKALFCNRNVKILQCSMKKVEAWDSYAVFISCLLDKKLIEQDDLESQCTGFYNRDWDVETLDYFSHFLKKLVSYSNCDSADKFAFLLDFLSDFCSDL